MAIKSTNVTVTTSATPLLTSTDADGEPGQGLSLKVIAGPVWIGGSDVTADAGAAGGRPLVTGDTFDFDLISGNDVPYGRTASGTATVHVFRTGA